MREVDKHMSTLEDFPYMNQAVGDGDENHRRIIIQKYVIFYKIDNQDIIVLRFIPQKLNYSQKLIYR